LLRQARALLEEAEAVADQRSNAFAKTWALQSMASLDLFLGRTEAALMGAKRSLELAQESEMKGRLSVGLFTLGRCLLATGKIDEGAALLRQGYEEFQASNGLLQATEWSCFAAEALLAAGCSDEASEYLNRGVVARRETEEKYYDAELHRLQGRVHAAKGDWGRAKERYDTAVRIAREQGVALFLVRALTDLIAMPGEPALQTLLKGSLAASLQGLEESYAFPDFVSARSRAAS
jgi:tetratricopeptide (TPR) repeat protein